MVDSPLSNRFTIAETKTFTNAMQHQKYAELYPKIKRTVYPQLKQNPFFGPHIKKLKGSLSHLYRFRIGKYRLFYEIDKSNVIVYILDIRDRKDAY